MQFVGVDQLVLDILHLEIELRDAAIETLRTHVEAVVRPVRRFLPGIVDIDMAAQAVVPILNLDLS